MKYIRISVFWGKVKNTFSCKNYSILEINYSSAIPCNLKRGIKNQEVV